MAREDLAIREGAVGAAGRLAGIVQVIYNLRHTGNHAHERHRAGGTREAEARVPIGAGSFPGFTIGPDNLELPCIDGAARREWPLREVVEIVSQIIAVEAEWAGARVVDFDPRIAVAKVIGDTGQVHCLHFVQP